MGGIHRTALVNQPGSAGMIDNADCPIALAEVQEAFGAQTKDVARQQTLFVARL